MKGFKKDKVSKKTAKKIMVALACMMATTLPFSQSVYAASPADEVHDTTEITDNTNTNNRVVNEKKTEGDAKEGSLTVGANGEVKRATGGLTEKGNATDNKVTVKEDATITGDGAIGGNSMSGGNAERNSVDIEGGTVDGTVEGGRAVEGTADGNTVTVTNGEITKAGGIAIMGGNSKKGAINNTVEIISTAKDKSITGDIIGGHSVPSDPEGTELANNTVKITGGTINGTIMGAYAAKDDKVTGAKDSKATGNTVNITGGEVDTTSTSVAEAGIYGAYTQGNVTNNAVNISGAEIKGDNDIVGGHSADANAEGNKVTVGGTSQIVGSVYGGRSGLATEDGKAIGNTVIISGGTIESKDEDVLAVAGGLGGSAEGNQVTIGGSAKIAKGNVVGGIGETTATNNSVTINLVAAESVIESSVVGGSSTTGDATNNKVILKDGKVNKNIRGGVADKGNANNNTVEVSDGVVLGSVVGGLSVTGTDKTANNNTVKITGGVFSGNIIGGDVSTGATATNNQIFISGGSLMVGSHDIVAGRINGTANIDENSNNNIYLGYADRNTEAALTKAVNVNTIAGETLYLGAFSGAAVDAGEDAGKAVIEVERVQARTIDLSKASVDRVVSGDFKLLKGKLSVANPVVGKLKMGSTLEQKVKMADDGTLALEDDTRTTQEQTTHAVFNAQAGVAALAAGNTLIERAATGLEADGFTGDNPQEWRAFAYVGGGRAEYATGSSVTTSTWNGMVGFGRHDKRKDGGSLTYGVFYEYGNGNYSTDDSSYNGDGQATYMGGGLLAKNETPKGVYYEGSLRAGRMTNDARNILRAAGQTYGYNKSSNYWGFHLGAGRVLRYNNGRSLDVYGKYFYNRLNGFSFDAGGRYDLDAVTTSLLRLGTRYNFWKQAGWTSYGGFAYEYEFGGEAGGFADGYAIRKADLGGSSAMFELGMKLQPDENSPWGVDLNLTAHAGQRKGVMGGATVSYAF